MGDSSQLQARGAACLTSKVWACVCVCVRLHMLAALVDIGHD